jgi:hypothetical protein
MKVSSLAAYEFGKAEKYCSAGTARLVCGISDDFGHTLPSRD